MPDASTSHPGQLDLPLAGCRATIRQAPHGIGRAQYHLRRTAGPLVQPLLPAKSSRNRPSTGFTNSAKNSEHRSIARVQHGKAMRFASAPKNRFPRKRTASAPGLAPGMSGPRQRARHSPRFPQEHIDVMHFLERSRELDSTPLPSNRAHGTEATNFRTN
jgi:hypothetical protein